MSAWIIQQGPDQANFLSVRGQLQGAAIDEEAQEQLRQLISRYRQAQTRRHNDDRAGLLLPIGRDLYRWLADRHLVDGLIANGNIQRLEFHLHSTDHLQQPAAAFADLLANVPWEILADDWGFLAKRNNGAFVVSRHFTDDSEQWPDSDHRLALHFMAASPREVQALDYRGEEYAIERSTHADGLDLFVEESGELKALAQRLRNNRDDVVNVVHLSLHGDHRGT